MSDDSDSDIPVDFRSVGGSDDEAEGENNDDFQLVNSIDDHLGSTSNDEESKKVLLLQEEIKELQSKLNEIEQIISEANSNNDDSKYEERSWKELDLARQHMETLDSIEEQKVINNKTKELVKDLTNRITEYETANTNEDQSYDVIRDILEKSDKAGSREIYLQNLLDKALLDKNKVMRVLVKLTGLTTSEIEQELIA